MTDNTDKLMAEALVECGHAKSFGNEGWLIMDGHNNKYNRTDYEQAITPFTDTLEGRRQADALEDWLLRDDRQLMAESNFHVSGYENDGCTYKSCHQWRLDRIKYCFKQLGEQQ